MKVLKNILQYNYIFYLLLIISIIYTFININYINQKSEYVGNENEIYGYILDYKIDGDKLTIILKSKEKIIINYYFENEEEKYNYNLLYGDYIYVKGSLNKPKDNTNFNLFNYRKYLLSQKINYVFNAENIKLVKQNNNMFYDLKRNILDRINKCEKSSNYLKTFIFADKNYIDSETFSSYQTLGISHLLAVSGMHVSLISLILLKLFNKLKEHIRYTLVSTILIFYLFLTNYTISMVRACFQFILFFINKTLNLKIKNSNIVIFLFSVLLFYNPYNIYNVGFIFSFSISFSLIMFNKIFINKNFFYSLFMVSLISFLVSTPILINNFYQINLLSILYNMFYVPYVTYILFPFNLLTLLFPILDNINYIFIDIFESVSNILSNFDFFIFDTAKIPILFIIIYYIVLVIIFKQLERNKFKNIFKIFIILIIFINYKRVVLTSEITFIDVGQGDSTLIRIFDKNILVDTGGKIKYEKENYQKRNKEYNISDTLITYFKSEGVKKIDYMIITHNDNDHNGEAIKLKNNFDIKNIIVSKYDTNEEICKNNKCISVKEDDILKINNVNFYVINPDKDNKNKNENSIVIYTKINNKNILLMGDASKENEKRILDEYSFKKIDILKVGHHGSNTSTSDLFIKNVNPDIAIISVSKNNIYHHPSKNVLYILNKYKVKIYMTSTYGMIKIKLYEKKLNVLTCTSYN